MIPTLLLRSGDLVKTLRFDKPMYVGDPINTVKLFNEKRVDEIAILDITASRERRPPALEHLREIASEAFMPLAYGGGISSVEHVEAAFRAGADKAVICTAAVRHPQVIEDAARQFGSQAVVVSIDAKRSWRGRYNTMIEGGRVNAHVDPVAHARAVEARGAGEILLNACDRDGTYEGYDLDLIAAVASAVGVPVIASGGARNLSDFSAAVRAGASAVAAGSMFIFEGRRRGVLVNYPTQAALSLELHGAG